MPTDGKNRLTSTEAKVFALYAAGKSRKLIAQELSMAPRTVSNHLQRAKKKTQNNNLVTFSPRAELAPSTSCEAERDRLLRVIKTDPGAIKIARLGGATKEQLIGLAACGAGEYKARAMSENGKIFKIMSKGVRNKVLFVSAERRTEANKLLAPLGLKPERVSFEGDATYVITPSEFFTIGI